MLKLFTVKSFEEKEEEVIVQLMTETSGRHTKSSSTSFFPSSSSSSYLLFSPSSSIDLNIEERPPTRINSKDNFICVEDDIIECISACVVHSSNQSKHDKYETLPQYSCFNKLTINDNNDIVTIYHSFLTFFLPFPHHFLLFSYSFLLIGLYSRKCKICV